MKKQTKPITNLVDIDSFQPKRGRGRPPKSQIPKYTRKLEAWDFQSVQTAVLKEIEDSFDNLHVMIKQELRQLNADLANTIIKSLTANRLNIVDREWQNDFTNKTLEAIQKHKLNNPSGQAVSPTELIDSLAGLFSATKGAKQR